MRKTACPNCGSTNVLFIGEGFFKCQSCGYTGTETGKKIYKKI